MKTGWVGLQVGLFSSEWVQGWGLGNVWWQVVPFLYCSWKVRVMVVIRMRLEGLETVGSSVARCSLNLCHVLLILHSCYTISHCVHHCESGLLTVCFQWNPMEISQHFTDTGSVPESVEGVHSSSSLYNF